MTDATSSPRERLEREIGIVLSSDLQAHVSRGAVVVVDAELSLLDVAVAVAEDDVEAVQNWIGSGRMKRPSTAQIEDWTQAPDRRFHSVIVRPYVLVQEIEPKVD